MKRAISLILLGLFMTLPLGAMAEGEQDTLVVAMGTQPLSHLDPARTTNRQTLVLYHNWGDTLLYKDPVTRNLVPCLARSYRFLDPHTIEFKLRKGVVFHNQEPFDAEAVQFSLQRLKKPGSTVSGLLQPLQNIEVLNDHTIRLTTSLPNPVILELIANALFIYPPRYTRQEGSEAFDKHPIGTGPYRFVSSRGKRSINFKANPTYFGGPKGKAKIPVLRARVTAEEMLQIENLINGTADMTRATNFYQQQVLFIQQDSRLKVKSNPSLRTCFLTMDAEGRSGISFFKDRRVRQAVNYAINKENIIQTAFHGLADSLNSATSPLHFGHEPEVMAYPYDPEKARTLLAAAGYPNGFRVDFYSGVCESASEAIVKDLAAVRIQARLHWMGGQWNRFYQKYLRGEMTLAFLTWGSYSIFDASAILNPFFQQAAPGCYGTTDEVDRLLTEADLTMDQAVRKAHFSRAQKIIAQEAFWVPLCNADSVTAMNRRLSFQPAVDEIDRYFSASWQNP
ncbi:MAG: ABC transporter substrate-binding protein [Desulfobacteraceae bacterium]